MENASKAIIIAGGILIALVIITVLVILFNKIGDVYSEEENSLLVEQMEEYNRKFSTYNRSLYGSEILSLINFIDDYHDKILQEVGGDKNAAVYKENKMTINIYMYKNIEGIEITVDELNNKVKKYKGYNKGNHNLEETKAWYNTTAKELQKEFKNSPFRCKHVEYNNYGRIIRMEFEQIMEELIK